MIRVNNKLKDMNNNDLRLLLQIHDELIFEVPNKNVDKISKVIKDEMTSVINSDLHTFSIPLLVDLNIGNNWGLLH